LKTLDGKSVSLASHKGKNIVVLDFWATWSKPSVNAMPITEKVAQEYKSKGVVLYAVNQKETAAKIRPFLAKHKFKVNVLLDPNKAVGNKYGANDIPLLVLIDKDGTVQKIKVGSNNLEQVLKQSLDALLAGKKLAKPAAAGGQNRQGGLPGAGGGFPGAGGGFPGAGGAPGGAGGFPGAGGAAGGAGGFPGAGGAAGGAGGFPGAGGAAGGAGGFPGAAGRGGFPGGKKKPQAKAGTPEYTADDFVAKIKAKDLTTAAAMVSSRARTPALKELRDGKVTAKQGFDKWTTLFNGISRSGAARSVRSDRVVTYTNASRQTIRFTLRRQGTEYKVYSIAIGSTSKKRRGRSR